MSLQNEKIIENKICRHCNTSFGITEKDLEFYEKVSPVFWWKKYIIPTPKLCPDCRQQRRLSFVNERLLYKRESDLSWKPIISLFSPDKKEVIVYDQKEWWDDSFGTSESQGFWFWSPFSLQFQELYKKIPKLWLVVVNSLNSEYNNYLENSKNSYLCIWNQNIEDSQYISASHTVKNSSDIWWSANIEFSYELFNCESVYKSFFGHENLKSYSLFFCGECIGCEECIFCYGLVNKKYCIYNQQYSQEEYNEKKKSMIFFTSWSIQEYTDIYRNFILSLPHCSIHTDDSSEQIRWDYIYRSIEALDCYNVVHIEKSRYVYEWWRSRNLYDCSFYYDGEGNSYESILVTGSSGIYFSYDIYNSYSIFYSNQLHNCSHCFWCVWLRNKSYCILNKQYTKEEYEILVPKIIEHMMSSTQSPSSEGEARNEQGEWWEFFPSSLSPFGYNETVAQEYFPLTREEVLNPQSLRDSFFIKGAPKNLLYVKEDAWKAGGFIHGKTFNWSDYEAPFPKVEKIITVEMYCNTSLLDNANNVPDDMLNWAIECEITKKPFRITKQELEFYRKHNLPIPRRHPDQRHKDRMQLRNPRKLWERKCDKCQEGIQTTYAPERPEIVYCEECYRKEVYL